MENEKKNFHVRYDFCQGCVLDFPDCEYRFETKFGVSCSLYCKFLNPFSFRVGL